MIEYNQNNAKDVDTYKGEDKEMEDKKYYKDELQKLGIEDLESVSGGSDFRFKNCRVCCIRCGSLVDERFTEFEAVNYINDHTCEKDGGPLEIFYID